MPDIQQLIAMLKGNNHNSQYDSCEELRVCRSPLPQEAIDAHILTTNDPHLDVADTAKRGGPAWGDRNVKNFQKCEVSMMTFDT